MSVKFASASQPRTGAAESERLSRSKCSTAASRGPERGRSFQILMLLDLYRYNVQALNFFPAIPFFRGNHLFSISGYIYFSSTPAPSRRNLWPITHSKSRKPCVTCPNGT